MAHTYHWKHGWVPLDHHAALQKAKGNHAAAAKMVGDAHTSGGIHSRQDVAKSLLSLHELKGTDHADARAAIAEAAQKHNATDLLPKGFEQHSPHGPSAPQSMVTEHGGKFYASGHDGANLGVHSSRREANRATVLHHAKQQDNLNRANGIHGGAVDKPQQLAERALAERTDARKATAAADVKHSNIADNIRNGGHPSSADVISLAGSDHPKASVAQAHLTAQARERVASSIHTEAERRAALTKARQMPKGPMKEAMVTALEQHEPTARPGLQHESIGRHAHNQAKTDKAASDKAAMDARYRASEARLAAAPTGPDSTDLHGAPKTMRLHAADATGSTHVSKVQAAEQMHGTNSPQHLAALDKHAPAVGYKVQVSKGGGFDVIDPYGVKVDHATTDAQAIAITKARWKKQYNAGTVGHPTGPRVVR